MTYRPADARELIRSDSCERPENYKSHDGTHAWTCAVFGRYSAEPWTGLSALESTLTLPEQTSLDMGMQQSSVYAGLVKPEAAQLQRYPISSTPPSRVPPPLANLVNA